MQIAITEKAGILKAGRLSGLAWWMWYSHRKGVIAALMAIAVCAVSLLAAGHAYAFDPLEAVTSIFDDWTENLRDGIYENMKNMLMSDQLTNSFNSLLGSKGGAYGKISNIAKSIIKPIGYSIVAICALVKMITISSRFDSSGVVVEIREVFFLMLYCVIFFALIDSSIGICEGLYNWIRDITSSVLNAFGGSVSQGDKDLGGSSFEKAFEAWFDIKHGGMVVVFELLIVLLTTIIASVVTWVVTFARYIQIYAFTAIAPIPLAFLANDETKQWGLGFIKNYVAICLAGVFLAFIIGIFPTLLTSVGNQNMFAFLGVCIVYIFALIKSGSWARDLLGG